jgi:tagatose 6-phosphate kinase
MADRLAPKLHQPSFRNHHFRVPFLIFSAQLFRNARGVLQCERSAPLHVPATCALPEEGSPVIICVSANPSLDQILVTNGFSVGGKIEPLRWTVSPGGSGVRIGFVAHQLGAPVVVTGFRGGGSGAWHERLMDAAGVKQDFVNIAAETRGTVLILEEHNGFLVELPGPVPSVSPEDPDRLLGKLKALTGKGDWVILSGRLPKDAPVDLYAQLIRTAHGVGAKVAVDARGPALMAALREAPELWKPNAAEMEEALAGGLDPVAQCGLGTTILLSEGKRGALLLRPARAVRFSPPPRRPWNPAGSGNALLAATVAALHGGASWEDAVRDGLAAGVANMRYDAAGHVTLEEVRELAHRVTMSEEPA